MSSVYFASGRQTASGAALLQIPTLLFHFPTFLPPQIQSPPQFLCLLPSSLSSAPSCAHRLPTATSLSCPNSGSSFLSTATNGPPPQTRVHIFLIISSLSPAVTHTLRSW